MAKPRRRDPKSQELARDHALDLVGVPAHAERDQPVHAELGVAWRVERIDDLVVFDAVRQGQTVIGLRRFEGIQ